MNVKKLRVGFIAMLVFTSGACHGPDDDIKAGIVEYERYVTDRLGTPNGPKKAEELFQKACSAGSSMGCYHLGAFYASGRVDETYNPWRILAKEMRASEAERGPIEFHEEQQPFDKAVEFLSKACDGQATEGCYGLAILYDAGPGRVEAEPVKAAELYSRAQEQFRRSCDEGEVRGCTGLGEMHLRGHGVPKDESKAAELFRKSCDQGNPTGCTRLGKMYLMAQAVPKDENKAFELFQKGCDGGRGPACDQLKDRQTAELERKACEGGSGGDCFRLSLSYGTALGTALDLPKSLELLVKACEAGDTQGCEHAGNRFKYGWQAAGIVLPTDAKKAAELYDKGCTGHDDFVENSCMAAGSLYESGADGLEKDLRRSAAYYRKACELKNSMGCDFAEAIEKELSLTSR